jgi:uncharacterized protein YciI
MAQYIYWIRPTRLAMLTEGPTEDEQRIVGEHFDYLKRLVDSGRLLMAGRSLNDDERTFGIAIFTASSFEDAERVLAEDPAVRHGVMRGDVFPFRIALWSDAGPSTPANL